MEQEAQGPRPEVDVKLASTVLPRGDANGVAPHSSMLVRPENRRKLWLGLVILSVPSITEDTDKNTTTAKLRVRRAELIVDPEDANDLERILMRAFERRTGAAVLPLELEQDVEAAFSGLDPGAIARELAAEADEARTKETEDYLRQREQDQSGDHAARFDDGTDPDDELLDPDDPRRGDDGDVT